MELGLRGEFSLHLSMVKEAISYRSQWMLWQPSQQSYRHSYPLGGHSTPKGDGGAEIIPAHQSPSQRNGKEGML